MSKLDHDIEVMKKILVDMVTETVDKIDKGNSAYPSVDGYECCGMIMISYIYGVIDMPTRNRLLFKVKNSVLRSCGVFLSF